jgi:hypothetical protein
VRPGLSLAGTGASRTNSSAPRATGPGSRPGHVIVTSAGGSGACHVGHRSGVGEAAGKLDAQGDAVPGQPEALVLPQDPVAARSSEQVDVRAKTKADVLTDR